MIGNLSLINWIKLDWDIGFIDPSSIFAENIFKLYNFIFLLMVVVLIVVLFIILRLAYLFNHKKINWDPKLNGFYVLKTGAYLYFLSFLDFLGISLLNLYCKNINNAYLNRWYLKENKNEFLKVNDLSEYKNLELIWCVFPVSVLFLIGGPSFSLLFSMDPPLDPVLTIRVVGYQWYWTYSYTNEKSLDIFDNTKFKVDNFVTYTDVKKITSVMLQEDDLVKGDHRLLEVDNRIVVPVGVPVRFLITANDVLHSWSVPTLGIKIDAVPGRLNQFITEIKKPGIFYGQCSELCGANHAFMPIVLQATTLSEYEAWLKN